MWWWAISPYLFNAFLGFWSVAVNTMERLQFLVLIINLYSLWVKFISWMTGSSVRYSMLQLVYFFLDNSVCTASLNHCCFRLNSWKSYCSTVSFTMRLLSASVQSVAMNQYVTKTNTSQVAAHMAHWAEAITFPYLLTAVSLSHCIMT